MRFLQLLHRTSRSSLKRSSHFQLPFGHQHHLFADMAMLSEDFNSEKMPEITHFYFDGEELTVKTAQKASPTFPRSTYYQCLRTN